MAMSGLLSSINRSSVLPDRPQPTMNGITGCIVPPRVVAR
jgi:hypothetical protein